MGELWLLDHYAGKPIRCEVVKRTAKQIVIKPESGYQRYMRTADLGRELFESERDGWLARERQLKDAIERSEADMRRLRERLASVHLILDNELSTTGEPTR